MTRLMMTAVFATLLAGCASTESDRSTVSAPHYWESTASTKQYNADNATCQQKTQIDADGQLDANSASFEAYRDCMIEQGYTLRNY